MTVVCLNTILDQGGKYNPKSEIIGGYLQDPQLSLVSKAFRAANIEAMSQMGRRIRMEDKAYGSRMQERAREICKEAGSGETLTRLFHEVREQIGALPFQQGDFRKIALSVGMEKAREIYERNLQEVDPQVRERRAGRFIVFLDEFKRRVAVLPQEVPHIRYPNDPYQQLIEQGKIFISRETLADRFKEVGGSFGALHVNQKNHVAPLRTQNLLFAQLAPRSFSLERFHEAEKLVFDAEFEGESALSQLWDGIRARVNAGPAVGAPTAEIRAWMNDDGNLAALARVTLSVTGLNTCPPEIGRLRGLRILRLEDGTLTTLPDELANLPRLSVLQLNDQRFTEMPEVVSRIPNLVAINLARNPDFSTVSDAFAQNYSSWVRMLFLEAAEDAMILVRPTFDFLTTWRDLNLFCARNQLTEIPFRLWFNDRFAIPHIPLMGAVPMGLIWVFFIGLIAEPIAQTLDEISSWLHVPAMIFFHALFSPLLAIALALLILDLPLLLISALLKGVVLPLVTRARDALGYSRMVHIDHPEPLINGENNP